ncbi:MAG: aminodeoxychorismate synthase component I [Nocardia sp.]|nr:aminodeoxychorismate synthase component I [Nocardia sp.]
MPVRTLLIDNYDSFTYNLFQLLGAVNGLAPTVIRNDEAGCLDELRLERFDNIVISPGPGRPDIERDFGISRLIVERAEIPVLGVCLGHQGIVIAAGGRVVTAPAPRHGYPDLISHDATDLFAGLPDRFRAVRYHSLCAAQPLPAALEVTAHSPDGVVMGVRHRSRPQWGVQFHPESVSSECGSELLRNFARLTELWWSERPGGPHLPANPGSTEPATKPPRRHRDTTPTTLTVRHEVIERAVDTETVYVRLYRNSPDAFWLDSTHAEPGLDRFSFLGDAAGPLAEVVRYRVGQGCVVEDRSGTRIESRPILDYLSAQLRDHNIEFPDVPFDFTGGYVGYLGYEMKADCGAPPAVHRSPYPDAQWIFADRFIVVDHVAGRTHLIALGTAAHRGECERWLSTTRSALSEIPEHRRPQPLPLSTEPVRVVNLRGRDRYLADIAAIDAALRAGETYEVNLTDTVVLPADADGLAVYRALRRGNPAPYAAYLRFGDCRIACSSPERFLKLDRAGVVESKPIKGTAGRGRTPTADARIRRKLESDPKTRAENLMIVDLLRNDLGRICELGSVHVPELMVTETYATLHQLVSTVRGRLRAELDAVDCLRACFPGGSMTGAPKARTMEIIGELETGARGIYSGTIGFLGLGGTADLNIVIRTAVGDGTGWRIGAGGAVVLDSDAEAEFEEMTLKAAAAARAVVSAATATATTDVAAPAPAAVPAPGR